MLECENYKMFYGRATITPRNANKPYQLEGVWLYRPDLDFWFLNKCKQVPLGTSFPANMISDIDDMTVAYYTLVSITGDKNV